MWRSAHLKSDTNPSLVLKIHHNQTSQQNQLHSFNWSIALYYLDPLL